MNGYVCFWNRKQIDVYAETPYEAQQKAVKIFQKVAGRKKIKTWDIAAVLAELDGKPVTHLPLM